MAKRNPHIGSSFDAFLKDDGIFAVYSTRIISRFNSMRL
jgi:hypothetical protein